ncbi:endonuclease/exonuclease/phosphatase family protein [Arthrobacter sp. MPF02]|uniref:endonuclease/exonuclease/phosphatase family protein n=1 Tax=Arthrobacter sp. MPF02 TaxID=3388492 RepID=UPI00398566A9
MRIPKIAALLSAASTLLALSVAPAAVAVPSSEASDHTPDTYSVLQLNLCLSGLAGCYPDTEYPRVVDEAAAKIETTGPDAVTVNEACSGDIARIAEGTGYDYRFATVMYRGAPLECTKPGGRGVFGNAVLVDGTITASEDQAFRSQLGSEERRWLCVETEQGVRACTAHLSVAGSAAQAATNQSQCEELTSVLARDGQAKATIFAGDVNRKKGCAPAGFWTATDADAGQAPGIQHAYGSRGWLPNPTTVIVPMTYTDHDGLFVESMLRPNN